MSRALPLFACMFLAACPGGGDPAINPNTPADATGATTPPPEGGITPTEDVKVEPGTGVVVSGTFAYTGDATGTYRIDISAPQEGGPPTPIAKLSLPEPGPWQYEVPKNLGTIMVLGFIEQGKGPSPDSPSATVYGLSVAETPLTDIVLAPALGGVITGTPPGPAAAGDPPPPGTDVVPASPEGGTAAPTDGVVPMAPGAPLPDGTNTPTAVDDPAATGTTTAQPPAPAQTP